MRAGRTYKLFHVRTPDVVYLSAHTTSYRFNGDGCYTLAEGIRRVLPASQVCQVRRISGPCSHRVARVKSRLHGFQTRDSRLGLYLALSWGLFKLRGGLKRITREVPVRNAQLAHAPLIVCLSIHTAT